MQKLIFVDTFVAIITYLVQSIFLPRELHSGIF